MEFSSYSVFKNEKIGGTELWTNGSKEKDGWHRKIQL